MATPRRLLARQSLLALLVSYLRDKVTSTAKFSFASPLPAGSYPMVHNVWSFTLDGTDLYQIRLAETEQMRLPVGVTLTFTGDHADQNRSMPQQWIVTVRVIVRTPARWDGSSAAHEIAQKIDEALYQSNGRTQLFDFSVSPATATTGILIWTRVPRGSWQFSEDDRLQEMRMEFEAKYSTPGGQGF